MSALIDEDLQISFDSYLADCKEYFDFDPNETYTTYYWHARTVIEDYIEWATNREEWMKETI